MDKSKKKAWETWKHVTNLYETHSLHEDLEFREFEKWYDSLSRNGLKTLLKDILNVLFFKTPSDPPRGFEILCGILAWYGVALFVFGIYKLLTINL